MEFNGQYLTYEEYRGLGGTLDLMPFNLLEYEARKKIDARTQNRLVNKENIPQEVKLCEYALINSINSYSNSLEKISNSGNLASESIDGYSVSYITPTQVSEVVTARSFELDDIIRTYLTGVVYDNEHLIFVGIE